MVHLSSGAHRLVLAALLIVAASVRAQEPPSAEANDRKIIADAKTGSEILANLTHLSDVIGPRLTGSAALKRANDWTAEKMKKYGLTDVRLEAWSMPEGWERGTARARVLEPDNGRTVTLASMGWTPGTGGKIEADVVYVKASKQSDLAAYKGKLKGAVVLTSPPSRMRSLEDMNKPFGSLTGRGEQPPGGERPSAEFRGALREFLTQEKAAALLNDSGKPLNLLSATGSWSRATGPDRPSAVSRVPVLSVAHDHYAMLHRLASRPAPAKTRIELEISNKFLPGPIAVYNTVGEIKGKDRPDEFVIIGAHLDSWDLGQGTLDNGTGTSVVLETARILAKCGVQPRRTIRFVLFTGEEQGLHGSRAYVEKYRAELPKTSACLIHDTGTGKVTGLGWMGSGDLKKVLEAELGALKDLGVTSVHGRAGGGSDHVPFGRAGVPACLCNQEIAGYRFAHHSQADTLEMAREADLVQGAQVLAVTAMRIANLDTLLPRGGR
jgi:hypothetical protein